MSTGVRFHGQLLIEKKTRPPPFYRGDNSLIFTIFRWPTCSAFSALACAVGACHQNTSTVLIKVQPRTESFGLSFNTTCSWDSRYKSCHGVSLLSADTGQWYALTNLPATESVFRDDKPTAHLIIAIFCDGRASVFRMERFHAENFPVSGVLESPKSVFAVMDYPLRDNDKVGWGRTALGY